MAGFNLTLSGRFCPTHDKGDTTREASSGEVSGLRQENEQLKQLVAELSLKNRLLKKSLTGLE